MACIVTTYFWTSETWWIGSIVLRMEFHVETLSFANRYCYAVSSWVPHANICWSGRDAERPDNFRHGGSSSGRPDPVQQGSKCHVCHQPVQLQQHYSACPTPWIRYCSHSQNTDWCFNLHNVSSLKNTVRKFYPFKIHPQWMWILKY